MDAQRLADLIANEADRFPSTATISKAAELFNTARAKKIDAAQQENHARDLLIRARKNDCDMRFLSFYGKKTFIYADEYYFWKDENYVVGIHDATQWGRWDHGETSDLKESYGLRFTINHWYKDVKAPNTRIITPLTLVVDHKRRWDGSESFNLSTEIGSKVIDLREALCSKYYGYYDDVYTLGKKCYAEIEEMFNSLPKPGVSVKLTKSAKLAHARKYGTTMYEDFLVNGHRSLSPDRKVPEFFKMSAMVNKIN